MPTRHIIGVSLFLISLAAGAEETKTTYSISGSSSTVTTIIKKASADKEKMLREYLFPLIADRLKTMPMVSSVEFNGDAKGEVSGSSWSDYWEYKRSYPVMVSLSLSTPVTMMLRVEESYRKCKSVAEKAANATTPVGGWGDDGGGSATDSLVDCSLGSSVKITGPQTIYGNFASSANVDKLLKEKQSIAYDLSRDYSNKADLKLEGKFNIESELFDQSLFKFLERLNTAPATEGVVTRNSLLLGIARVLRVQNESMVEK